MEECVDTCISVLAGSVAEGEIIMIEAVTVKCLLSGEMNMEGEIIG